MINSTNTTYVKNWWELPHEERNAKFKELVPMDEVDKLEEYLRNHGIRYDRHPLFAGEQICVIDEHGNWIWDVICHEASWGGFEGLLEYREYKAGGCEPTGYLTASDVIEKTEADEWIQTNCK